jgi:hypothetical protein
MGLITKINQIKALARPMEIPKLINCYLLGRASFKAIQIISIFFELRDFLPVENYLLTN